MKKAGHDKYIENACQQYWQTLEPALDPPMDDVGYLQFLEWYIHDYPIAGQGRPVIQLFLESKPKLSPEEMQVLQDWQSAYISVFQVKKVEPGKGILAEDIFSGEEGFLSESVWPPKWPKSLVEMRGFEPLTSCMRSRRSSS